MSIKPISEKEREAFNRVVNHPLQSYEWGEFREKTGVKVIRRGIYEGNELLDAFQLTIHTIPRTPWTIGYLPKGNTPTKETLDELYTIGKEQRCVFIQLEPNITVQKKFKTEIGAYALIPAAHPLFTKFTFVLDISKSEEELLKNMHPKTRYNIRVAAKHGVKVTEDHSKEAFERYWELTEETTKRQGFYAHTKKYHNLQWNTFSHSANANALSYHLLTATYHGKILTTMLFFSFHDTLYYPYGASSNEERKVMHSTLTMWEGIRLGKRLGLTKLDMWGALGTDPDPKDPWFGFHDFKRKYGPDHIEFVGSYDLVIKSPLYEAYKIADKIRWVYLKLKR